MTKIAVLGGGRVGSAIAIDLAQDHHVTLIDRSRSSLENVQKRSGSVETLRMDLLEDPIQDSLSPFDLIVLAVPGFMGFRVLEKVIRAGKDVVDISFFSEDPFALDPLARENGVTAIVDAGVAPGLDNLILGFWDQKMNVNRFDCLVGGLPVDRTLPFEYKAPFSPIDVIEEYTRPARLHENGQLVVREALTEVEWVEFPGIGTLEAFNSDGLRTLLTTCSHIPEMREKTLRYPGHAHIIMSLKKAGFFDTHPIEAGGQKVIPLEVTNSILFNQWKLNEGEEEFTVMRVDIHGEDSHDHHFVRYELLDRTDPSSGTSSMARTTGYTATSMVRLILEKKFTEKGIQPLENVGRIPGCFDSVLNHLKERGVIVNSKAEAPENW